MFNTFGHKRELPQYKCHMCGQLATSNVRGANFFDELRPNLWLCEDHQYEFDLDELTPSVASLATAHHCALMDLKEYIESIGEEFTEYNPMSNPKPFVYEHSNEVYDQVRYLRWLAFQKYLNVLRKASAIRKQSATGVTND